MPASRAERIDLIRALQQARGDRLLLAYVTSTRPNVEVMMRMDIIPIVYEHLKAAGLKKKDGKIDLFLHTNGGEGVVPWRLITLLREFANEVNLLVPHRAYSAGTLTALGADAVVMHPMGTLGPIDPTVGNPFNPLHPQTNQPLGISVEDLAAYISLVREDVGIRHEDELVEAFRVLAEKVHPLALGNVKRQSAQSRMMAEKLLRGKDLPQHVLNDIIEKLGSKLYFHAHPINRSEARDDLGMTFVEDAEPAVEEAMWALYSAYSQDMLLDREWQHLQEAWPKLPPLPNPPQQVGPGQVIPSAPAVGTVDLEPLNTVRVESLARSDVRRLRAQITVTRDYTGAVGSSVLTILEDRWVQET